MCDHLELNNNTNIITLNLSVPRCFHLEDGTTGGNTEPSWHETSPRDENRNSVDLKENLKQKMSNGLSNIGIRIKLLHKLHYDLYFKELLVI